MLTTRYPHRSRIALAGLSLALALSIAGPASGQVAKSAAAPPSGPPIPLASYVPGGDLFLYLEFAGVEAHADAWKKTAAYKILNDTPTGAMFEDVLTQLINQTLVKDGKLKVSGTEAVALLKHLATHGFVFASWGKVDAPGDSHAVFVVRGAFKNKELRPAIGRLLGGLSDPKVKAKPADVDGHKIAVAKLPTGEFVGYWVDDVRREDLIVIPPMTNEAVVTSTAAAVFSAIEGKTPSAKDDPKRLALAKEEDGFVPVGVAYLKTTKVPAELVPPAEFGFGGFNGFDYRWGFQDKELVSIGRLDAPAPRKGLFSLLEMPTFDKSSLPPIPEGVSGFSVFTLDLNGFFDRLAAFGKTMPADAAAEPGAGANVPGMKIFFIKFSHFLSKYGTIGDSLGVMVKAKTRLRLREDILAHIGPKVAVYSAPAKSGASDAPKAGFNPLSAMMGGATIPRVTIVAEIDNPTAVGKTLDELMILLNQQLRSAIPRPGGDPAAGKAAAKGSGSGLEFKLVPGNQKAFMLAIPSELTSMLPTYVRPTIRVGPKHLVFSVSPEAARAALEVKGAGAGTTFATALQTTPAKLVYLGVADPSEPLSTALASFPGKLQAAVNQARNPTPMMMPPMGGPGGQPGMPSVPSGPPGGSNSSGAGGDTTSRPGGGSSSSGSSSGSSSSGSSSGSSSSGSSSSGSSSSSSGAPNVPGAPGFNPGGSGSGTNAAGDRAIVLQVDPAKMPTAAAIKPLLFPATTSVALEDAGLRIVTRQAFPNLSGLVSSNPLAAMISGRMGAPTPGLPGGPIPGVAPGAIPNGPQPGAPGAPAGRKKLTTPGGS